MDGRDGMGLDYVGLGWLGSLRAPSVLKVPAYEMAKPCFNIQMWKELIEAKKVVQDLKV